MSVFTSAPLAAYHRPEGDTALLSIRSSQLGILATDLHRRNPAPFLSHARRHHPERCAALGEVELLAVVDAAIVRGGGYGLTSQRDLCRFLDIVLVIGDDPQREFDWLDEVLSNPATTDPGLRLDRARRRLLYALEAGCS
ncbi:MAG TPA: hypothetical protein VK034_18960 [Enhygromyxa sp.]|nr:hypothetical protein [Enhygromyxa sp.]